MQQAHPPAGGAGASPAARGIDDDRAGQSSRSRSRYERQRVSRITRVPEVCDHGSPPASAERDDQLIRSKHPARGIRCSSARDAIRLRRPPLPGARTSTAPRPAGDPPREPPRYGDSKLARPRCRARVDRDGVLSHAEAPSPPSIASRADERVDPRAPWPLLRIQLPTWLFDQRDREPESARHDHRGAPRCRPLGRTPGRPRCGTPSRAPGQRAPRWLAGRRSGRAACSRVESYALPASVLVNVSSRSRESEAPARRSRRPTKRPRRATASSPKVRCAGQSRRSTVAAALLFAGAFVRLGDRTRGTPGAALDA